MKKAIIILTIGLLLTNFGCTEIKDIKSVKTIQHINIPGTRAFIILPKEFKFNPTTSVFQKGDSSSVVGIELLGADYFTSETNLSRTEFEKRGMKVIDYNEIHVNEYNGKLALIQGFAKQNPTAYSYYLVFGDSTFCINIIGTYKDGDKKSKELIKTSLNSIFYDKTTKPDRSYLLDGFKLEDSKTLLKFASYIGTSCIYTKNGLDSENAYPILTVSKVSKGNYTVKSLGEIVLNNLKNSGYTDFETTDRIDSPINGFDSFETINYGTFKGKKYLINIHTVLIDNNFINLIGFSNGNFDEDLLNIRQLVKTIDRKSTRP